MIIERNESLVHLTSLPIPRADQRELSLKLQIVLAVARDMKRLGVYGGIMGEIFAKYSRPSQNVFGAKSHRLIVKDAEIASVVFDIQRRGANCLDFA